MTSSHFWLLFNVLNNFHRLQLDRLILAGEIPHDMEHYAPIQHVPCPGRTAGSLRNCGLDHAIDCDLTIFMDADDTFLPHHVRILSAQVETGCVSASQVRERHFYRGGRDKFRVINRVQQATGYLEGTILCKGHVSCRFGTSRIGESSNFKHCIKRRIDMPSIIINLWAGNTMRKTKMFGCVKCDLLGAPDEVNDKYKKALALYLKHYMK